MKQLTDEIIIQSYDSLVEGLNWKDRLGYVNLKELYQHLRKNHIKNLTIEQFKKSMFDFWIRKCPDEFSFSHGSSIRKEARTYAFCVKGYMGGLYFYLRKRGKDE